MSEPDLAGDQCPPAAAARVGANLAAVRERIAAAGRDPAGIGIVAVTKGFGLAAVRAALAAGLEDVGENYADELCAKAERLRALGGVQPRWHFLGAIQRNKVARLAAHVTCFEGVDRLVEGERLARLAPGAALLVEVDLTGSPGRGGVPAAEVPRLVAALAGLGLRVEGLMTVAPPGDARRAAAAFSTVAALAADLGLKEVSMGMSDDYELAVRAGATRLRLGRVLFGERPRPQR